MTYTALISNTKGKDYVCCDRLGFSIDSLLKEIRQKKVRRPGIVRLQAKHTPPDTPPRPHITSTKLRRHFGRRNPSSTCSADCIASIRATRSSKAGGNTTISRRRRCKTLACLGPPHHPFPLQAAARGGQTLTGPTILTTTTPALLQDSITRRHIPTEVGYTPMAESQTGHPFSFPSLTATQLWCLRSKVSEVPWMRLQLSWSLTWASPNRQPYPQRTLGRAITLLTSYTYFAFSHTRENEY